MLQIFVTQDKEHEEKIRAALKNNDGYCPCKLGKLQENICQCEEFLNQDSEGFAIVNYTLKQRYNNEVN